jgi:hypothetical protein
MEDEMSDGTKGAVVAAAFIIGLWLLTGIVIRPEWFGLS